MVIGICSATGMHLTFGLTVDYLWFVLMVVCGAVIYLAVFLILTAVSFWFEDRVGIVPPVFNMLTFGRYPLTIYNVFHPIPAELDHPFRLCLVLSHHALPWATDFRCFIFILCRWWRRRSSALAVLVWNRGVANYSSTGT